VVNRLNPLAELYGEDSLTPYAGTECILWSMLYQLAVAAGVTLLAIAGCNKPSSEAHETSMPEATVQAEQKLTFRVDGMRRINGAL